MSDATGNLAPPPLEAVRFLADAGIPRALTEDIVARVSRRIALPCRLHTEPWENQPRRLDRREQIDADALLADLELSAAPGVVQVGITGHDLGLPLFTFVFGRALRHGHSAIVSLSRLGPERYGLDADPDLTARRAVAEIIHEFGHVAGLVHCPDLGCVMHFATNVESIDLRGRGFCATCAAELPRHLLTETSTI